MQPIFATLLALAAPVAAQDTPLPRDAEIVVTGTRLSDTEKALDACLARKCPPREDIAATLAHTENLFVAGRYDDAQQVTASGIRRNKRHASELPRQVAGLLRAHARLSGHIGETELQRSSTLDMITALQAGLPSNDADVLVARIELADTYAKEGQISFAETNYRQVAKAAQAAGNPTVEGYARFRHASMLAMLARGDKAYTKRARSMLQNIADTPMVQQAAFAEAARITLARMDARSGDASEIGKQVAGAYRGGPTVRPTLLYSEPINLTNARTGLESGSTTNRMSTDSVEDQWIDVSFEIGADGVPIDIETIRTSASYSGAWADVVLAAIRTRRYAPIQLAAGQPGLLRIERYTKTAPYIAETGTRVRQRSPAARIEVTDMSVDPTVPSAGSATQNNQPAA